MLFGPFSPTFADLGDLNPLLGETLGLRCGISTPAEVGGIFVTPWEVAVWATANGERDVCSTIWSRTDCPELTSFLVEDEVSRQHTRPGSSTRPGHLDMTPRD